MQGTTTNRPRQPGVSFTIDYLLFDQGKPPQEAPEPREIQDSGFSRGQDVPAAAGPELQGSPDLLDKPNLSYIALISTAILSSPEKKLLLCDIYQWIMDKYPYFKNKINTATRWIYLTKETPTDLLYASQYRNFTCRFSRHSATFLEPLGKRNSDDLEKSWRNSVRHNLSLNECFVKAGRSDNGKGHFWAIHPANLEDFSKGDYHRRRARRRIRRMAVNLGYHLPYAFYGLSCCPSRYCLGCSPYTHPSIPAPPPPCLPGFPPLFLPTTASLFTPPFFPGGGGTEKSLSEKRLRWATWNRPALQMAPLQAHTSP